MWWIAGALVCVLAVVADRARALRERFTPLTDAEFLALCPPGTNPEVALKVRRMCAEHFAIDYESVYPSMTFVEDLGAD